MKQQPPEGASASPIGDDNLLVWGGTIFGPDDTPWEGGIFSLRLTFTEQYPDKPPRVRFTSEMVRLRASHLRRRARSLGSAEGTGMQPTCSPARHYLSLLRYSLLMRAPVRLSRQFHPNIYPDGTLCMDLIQDNWSPVYSVGSILMAIRSLLTDPNCASPANPEAAQLFQADVKGYNRRVRRVAEKSTG